MAETPTPVVRLVPGVVQVAPGGTAGSLVVNVGGTYPPVWWPAGYIPAAGDAVKVLLVDGIAVVHSPVITTGRPLTGTVAGTATAGTVPVTTTSGVLACRYTGSAPAVGVIVRLDWQATEPWVWPSAASTVPPVTPGPGGGGGNPTPPPTSTSGTLSVTALDSGTYNARYANWTGQNGLDLTQGTWSGVAYTGAWFYGGAAGQLAGAAVSQVRIRLGNRRHIGNYNSPLDLTLYATSNGSKPGGDTSRVLGPFVVTLAPNASAQWVELPWQWGPTLVAGGGVAIAGGGYGGVDGIGADPASGQLQIDWRR